MESFILWNDTGKPIDISAFFSHYHFPKLQRLELVDCMASSWNLVTLRATALTTLVIRPSVSLSPPTTSQLFSILASYPTHRKVSLCCYESPGGGGRDLPSRVSLHHLKELSLCGNSQTVFRLLHRLDHPSHMDYLDITLDCPVGDISHTIGPYLRDCPRRCGRSRSGLGLSLFKPGSGVGLRVGDVRQTDFSALASARVNLFVRIAIVLDREHPRDLPEKAILHLIAHTPREEIV